MNIWRLLLFLIVGTIAMLVPIIMQGAWYKIKLYRRVFIALLLTITGTFGTFFMFFVENGRFGGTSFYGAIFFVPIVFALLTHFIKVPYGELMDVCAPAECTMLGIMKVQCFITGCCGGRLVHVNDCSFIFPSQIVELVSALIIGIVLLLMSRNIKMRGQLFPWYMVIYGVVRFVLNLFRNVKNMNILPIPAGNLWSIVSIVVGGIWLLLLWKKQKCRDVRL